MREKTGIFTVMRYQLPLRRIWRISEVFCLSILFVILISYLAVAETTVDKDSCTYKGINLYGNVQVVQNFPDIKIQVVKAFPDLRVQRVNVFPDRCGLWKMVDSFPDFKVQYVNAFPDIKIELVNSFPGVP